MEELLNFFKEFNVQTILSMGLIVWYFSRDVRNCLDSRIDKLELKIGDIEKELKDDIKIQSARSDKLYENFCDLLKTAQSRDGK